jgi:hypothetical protein
MGDMRVSEALRRASDLIADPARWTKSGYATRADGMTTHPVSSSATCWSAYGAIQRICWGDSGLEAIANDWLRWAANCVLLVHFHNDPATRHADVIDALRRAADAAELAEAELFRENACHSQ